MIFYFFLLIILFDKKIANVIEGEGEFVKKGGASQGAIENYKKSKVAMPHIKA